MYTGTLAAASNRADWKFTCELVDSDTGDDIDLTGATITIAVRPQDASLPILTGTTADKITITGTGTFDVAFTPADMHDLCAGSYDVGLTVLMASGTTYQLMSAVLPVIDGVVDP